MQRYFIRWFATALVVAVLGAPGAAFAKVGVGDRVRDFVAAKDGQGKRVKLKKYRKKIVVLTFGASWCKPCKSELPAWDKVAVKYKAKGVVVIAMNIDKDLAKGKAFMAKAKLKAMRAVYEPEGASVESFEPPTMPTTYIIDGNGIVRHVHTGYRSGDEKGLAKQLDKLLAKKSK
jgi:peroxiredoxin